MSFDDPERLLDVSEAAALLHVKGKTLYAWVSRNKIPYRKICSLVRFPSRGINRVGSGAAKQAANTKTQRVKRGKVALLLLSDGC